MVQNVIVIKIGFGLSDFYLTNVSYKFTFWESYVLEQVSKFELASDFNPTGDQPQAIDALVEGVKKGTVQT